MKYCCEEGEFNMKKAHSQAEIHFRYWDGYYMGKPKEPMYINYCLFCGKKLK